MKEPTTRDIATLAGVSQATVSYVLNGRLDQAISDQTRRRVLDAAARLRYRPNRLASGFFGGRSGTIGVVFPCADSSFFSRMLFGIQNVCLEYDSLPLLNFTQTDPASERKVVNRMLEHRVDGLLVVVSSYTTPWFDDVRVGNIPFVIINDRSHEDTCDTVASDDIYGARQAVEYLIGLGHRRVAMIGASDGSTTDRDRRAGYMAALQDAGLDADPGLLKEAPADESPGHYASDVFHMLDELRPTAIFATTDYHAHDCIKALRQRGLSVPEDISIVGYGDTELSAGLDLTTVRQDAIAMGSTAAVRLFEKIGAPSQEHRQILTPTDLVLRRTCCAPTAKRELALTLT